MDFMFPNSRSSAKAADVIVVQAMQSVEWIGRENRDDEVCRVWNGSTYYH